MLKINRNNNFDHAVGVILHTSIDECYDLDNVIFIIKDEYSIIYTKFK